MKGIHELPMVAENLVGIWEKREFRKLEKLVMDEKALGSFSCY